MLTGPVTDPSGDVRYHCGLRPGNRRIDCWGDVAASNTAHEPLYVCDEDSRPFEPLMDVDDLLVDSCILPPVFPLA